MAGTLNNYVEAVTRLAFPCSKCNSASNSFGKLSRGSQSAPAKKASRSVKVTCCPSWVCICQLAGNITTEGHKRQHCLDWAQLVTCCTYKNCYTMPKLIHFFLFEEDKHSGGRLAFVCRNVSPRWMDCWVECRLGRNRQFTSPEKKQRKTHDHC